MKSATLLASLAMLAATISTPLVAGDREQDSHQGRQHVTKNRTANGFDQGIKEVSHSASPNTPGHGWRYFTDPATRRAVVISPQGDYYYSRCMGLHWIAAEQT